MKKERLLNAIGQIDDRLISGADPQVHMHRKKIRRQWIAALAACLVLMIGIGAVAPIALGNQEAGKVTMEINPGVEYTITKKRKCQVGAFSERRRKGSTRRSVSEGRNSEKCHIHYACHI